MFRCFVVSLNRAKARRESISTRLDELGIEYSFIDAIDGAQRLTSEQQKLIHPSAINNMSTREIACALSHAMVYEKMVDDEIDHALILEDDALLLQEIGQFIKNRCYELRPMFLLFHGRAYVKRRESLALFDGVEALPLNMSCSYAVAYTINLASAKKLLAACRPVHSIADWPIDISQLDAHITQPVLVQHPPDTSLSEIGKDRTRKAKDRKRYFKASYYLRRWLRWVSKRIEEEKLN